MASRRYTIVLSFDADDPELAHLVQLRTEGVMAELPLSDRTVLVLVALIPSAGEGADVVVMAQRDQLAGG